MAQTARGDGDVVAVVGVLKSGSAKGTHSPLRWHRTVAIALALILVIYAGFATFTTFRHGPAVDFISFWAAGRLTLGGHPAAAYDIAVHKALELTVGTIGNSVLPFPYPPPFLFFVTPFSLLPYWLAFASWVAVTGAIYVTAFRRVAPLPYSLAHPAALMNALIGQNGLLTSAIFVAGVSRLDRRPLLAGAILGILVIKPQLALLLPVAVIAGHHWRAIGGAALSGGSLLLVGLIAFGPASYAGFLGIARQLTVYIEHGQFPWSELASVFALFRYLGVPQSTALWLHGIVAVGAAAVTAWAWWRKHDARMPILAAATLLIPPYVWTYDTVLMMVPIGWLITNQRQPWLIVLLWLLCALPISAFWGIYHGPNPIPVAALLSIYAMVRESADSRPRAEEDHARVAAA